MKYSSSNQSVNGLYTSSVNCLHILVHTSGVFQAIYVQFYRSVYFLKMQVNKAVYKLLNMSRKLVVQAITVLLVNVSNSV